MRNRRRIYIEGIPYFCTVVAYQRREIYCDSKIIRLLISVIKEKRDKYKFKFLEFVVMPDHYHCLITPATRYTTGDTLHHINGVFSQRFNKVTGQHGRVIQPDYYDHAVSNELEYISIAEYIHNNPVKAGFVSEPEDYPWSSARNRILGDNSLIELNDINL